MDIFVYWYLLPIGITIAVLAMSAGISGTNFWIPVYLLWLGFDDRTGFWLALLTMIFGFGSGIVRNLLQKTINWKIVCQYLPYTVVGSLVGTLLVPYAPSRLLLAVFSVFVMTYGCYLVARYFSDKRSGPNKMQIIPHCVIYRERAVVAGFLKGLIATGLGKLILPGIIGHKDIRSAAEAVGTTTMIIFCVNCIALVFRLTPDFTSALVTQGNEILQVMIWVAPGVVIGGQLGPRVATRLSADTIKGYVGALLIIVSLLIGYRAL